MKKVLQALLGVMLAFVIFVPDSTHAQEVAWTAKANLLETKDRVNLVTVNGKIYSIGGMRGSTLINAIDEYDPSSDTWIQKTKLPSSPLASASSVVLNGKIYILGGIYSSGSVTSAVHVYDPLANIWTKAKNMPATIAGQSAQVINGKILMMGGFTYYTNAISNTYEYDPNTDNWSTKANMLVARRYITSAQVNGKVYAIGGVDSNILSSIEEYDPDKNTWIKKATMPVGAVGSSAVSLNNEFYVIGGMTEQATTSGPATAQTNKYNPATDTWTRMPDISIARGLSSSVVLDGKIYVAGGSNNSTYYNTFEMLDLASTLPPVVQEPTPPPGTGEPAQPSNPTIPLGDRAILVVTMINGLEKEYDLPMSEIEAFTSWYDAKDAGKGPARFVIDKHSNNKGPFSKRTDSVIFNNILTFEVSEYTLK